MTVKASTDSASRSFDTVAAIASVRRAALAHRYASESFAVEWRELSQLHAVADEWRALAERALAPNVFYEPDFALAAAPLFGRDCGAVLVWSGTAPRKLLGFFPARIERRRYGLKLPVLVGWTHPFAPFGVPLVEREAAEPVISAWLAHLAKDERLPGLLLMQFLPQEGPFAASLTAVLRRGRTPRADFNRHERALLAPAGDRRDYVERALGSRKYRELRRTVRRLCDAGAVLFTTARQPADVRRATDDFLALEASGWKGKAGTAAASDDEVRDFLQTAIAALAAEQKAAIDRILLDGRPVAAAITLYSGDGAWFWKIAYDEAQARFSPGVMLTALVTERLAEDAIIACTDSCATADHAVMNRTWSERLALHDLLIAVRPGAPFSAAQRLETMRLATISAARNVRGWFRQ